MRTSKSTPEQMEYWPSIYLVDRCERIRVRAIGEVHANEESGRRLDGQIETLLGESPNDCRQS